MKQLVRATKQFDRDLRRAKRRGENLEVLWRVIEALKEGRRLETRHRVHKLSGDWVGFWECHVEPDWLLIWRLTEDALILVRTGTHSDIFE